MNTALFTLNALKIHVTNVNIRNQLDTSSYRSFETFILSGDYNSQVNKFQIEMLWGEETKEHVQQQSLQQIKKKETHFSLKYSPHRYSLIQIKELC